MTSTATFSLPEVVIELFATFQPKFEAKHCRLNIKLESDAATNWHGDGSQVRQSISAFIEAILNQIESEKSLLFIHISKSDNHLLVSQDAKDRPEPLMLALTPAEGNFTEDLVQEWQLKDIEVSDLVAMVVKTLPERLAKLHRALVEEDTEVLESEVHALKGVSGNFKMTELYDVLYDLERHIRATHRIDDECHRLVQALASVIYSIPKKYLDAPTAKK